MPIAFVNGVTGSGKATASVSTSTGLSVTRGNVLIATAHMNYNGTPATPTDSVGNTYYFVNNSSNGSSSSVSMWIAINLSTNVFNTLTITGFQTSAGDAAVITLTQYSGVKNRGALGANSSGSGTSATASVTTTAANSWIVGAVAAPNKTTITAGASTTIEENLTTSGGAGSTNVGGAEGDSQNVANSGTGVTLTFNLSASVNWSVTCFELIGTTQLSLEPYTAVVGSGRSSVTFPIINTFEKNGTMMLMFGWIISSPPAQSPFVPPTVSSISDSNLGLTWSRRTAIKNTAFDGGFGDAAWGAMEIWSAPFSSQILNISIAANVVSTQNVYNTGSTSLAYGFQQGLSFDQDSFPVNAVINDNKNAQTTVSTYSSPTLVIFNPFLSDASSPIGMTTPLTFTSIIGDVETSGRTDAIAYYKIFATSPTNFTISTSATTGNTLADWIVYSDAFIGAYSSSLFPPSPSIASYNSLLLWF